MRELDCVTVAGLYIPSQLVPERNSCTCMGQEGKDLHNTHRKKHVSVSGGSEEEDLSVIVSLRFVFVVFCSPGELSDRKFSM